MPLARPPLPSADDSAAPPPAPSAPPPTPERTMAMARLATALAQAPAHTDPLVLWAGLSEPARHMVERVYDAGHAQATVTAVDPPAPRPRPRSR